MLGFSRKFFILYIFAEFMIEIMRAGETIRENYLQATKACVLRQQLWLDCLICSPRCGGQVTISF